MKNTQRSAAIIIIGDELLSGRTQDVNSYFFIKQLSALGVKVQFCLIIPDDAEIIGRTVVEYSMRVTWTFVSGGIGPTHDDITMKSMAAAFNVPLVSNPVLVRVLKTIYGKKCTPEHLKMSNVPEGTVVITGSKTNVPVIKFQNIYIFPGVPELMKSMFRQVKDDFKGIVLPVREISLNVDEGEILAELQQTVDEFPDVKIGSYPSLLEEGFHVKIVLEHENEAYLDKVYVHFINKVGKQRIM